MAAHLFLQHCQRKGGAAAVTSSLSSFPIGLFRREAGWARRRGHCDWKTGPPSSQLWSCHLLLCGVWNKEVEQSMLGSTPRMHCSFCLLEAGPKGGRKLCQSWRQEGVGPGLLCSDLLQLPIHLSAFLRRSDEEEGWQWQQQWWWAVCARLFYLGECILAGLE